MNAVLPFQHIIRIELLLEPSTTDVVCVTDRARRRVPHSEHRCIPVASSRQSDRVRNVCPFLALSEQQTRSRRTRDPLRRQLHERGWDAGSCGLPIDLSCSRSL